MARHYIFNGFGLGVLLLALVGGCSTPRRPSAQIVPGAFDAIYVRQSARFALAAFHKPREVGTNSAELSFNLAPLLIQETSPGVDPASVLPDTVYYFAGTQRVGTGSLPQMTYFWGIGSDASGGLQAQGVRITLDPNGRPVIWQILHDPSGASLFFVSRAVETAAQREFGGLLYGRKYVVEPDLRQAPGVVVGRIIDDGPVPMGPVLYLQARSPVVSTLICRCMAAQADALAGTSTYLLNPAPPGLQATIEAQFADRGLGRTSATPSLPLRLPAHF